MVHYAKIEKPRMTDGVSDPVNVFTDNGQLDVAWFQSNDGYWHTKDGDTFGNVLYWVEIEFPKGWSCDWKSYGG
jgi:hypothetical protein